MLALLAALGGLTTACLIVAALAVGGMAVLVGARLHTQLTDPAGDRAVAEERHRLAPAPTSATVDVDAIAARSKVFGLPEVFIPVPDLGEAAQAAVRYGLFLSGGATIVVHVASDAERAFAIADAWASRHPSLSVAQLQLVVADAPPWCSGRSALSSATDDAAIPVASVPTGRAGPVTCRQERREVWSACRVLARGR